MSLVSGWWPALRIAWRDVRRSRARTILVLAMIALPVLAVSAADVVYATSKVSTQEGLGRRLGSADARLTAMRGVHHAAQWIDPDSVATWSGGRGSSTPGLADAEAVLGRHLPAVPVDTGVAHVTTRRGAISANALETDLADPLARGLFRLASGRWPRTTGEVVVNAALAGRGFGVGSTLTVGAGARKVVGIAESTTIRSDPVLAGLPGSLAVHTGGRHTWLVGGGPVSWSDVRSLNAIGMTVLSRQVIDHPPSESLLPPQVRYALSSNRTQILTILALVVSMALLEVVLLAGPAFAVGARRQARTLALMSASGGTPRQARRVILASGLVLGSLAAVTGAALGVAVGWAVLPWVQGLSTTWFGPFQVNWLQLLGITGFGVLSALLAAVVPAWIASRQDVVAVLAGRRGDRRPSLRSPLVGALLLGLGVAGAVAGAKRVGGGEFLIAGSAIVSVVGMIFCVPLVVVGLARVSGRLPLVGRYAVRDAARHRTRTVPAVAAVAATVAGVVALGVANASDAAQGRATYEPLMRVGTGAVSYFGKHPDWATYAGLVRQYAPDAQVTPVRGIGDAPGHPGHGVLLSAPGHPTLVDGYNATVGTGVLVSNHVLPSVVSDVPQAEVGAAEAMLARGGAVVMSKRPVAAHRVLVRISHGRRAWVPALYVVTSSYTPSALAVVSPRVAAAVGVRPRIVGLALTGTISQAQESAVQEAFGGLSNQLGLYVERGYTADQATRILLLILGVLGGVLMLGGTLTATFLALSDARPDLATLSAVGASPRTRRGVAAAYALVVGFVGAVLGAAVGFIPGIAITYPLTGTVYMSAGAAAKSHYLVVPWPLILTLVVGLPLLTALVVGLAARSRLPLVARLD